MPPLDTTITAVTVFHDQARITRSGTTLLEPGEHLLALADVPVTLIPDSVRARGQGAGVTLLGVDVKTEHLAELPEQAIRGLEDQLDGLREQDSGLADEDRVLSERLEWLQGLAASSGEMYARGLSQERTTLESVTALGDYLTAQAAQANARRREIAAQRRDLAKHIDALERRLAQLRHPRSTTRYEIHVGVQAAAVVELALEVEYGVRQASWQPVYDLRLDEDRLTLTYMAMVSQSTGEDWPEVALALSTARPQAGAALPELSPWYVDRYQPPVLAYAPQPKASASSMLGKIAGAAVAPAAAVADAFLAEREAEPAPPPPAEIAQASVDGGGGSGALTYRIARPVAVPSDGTPHHTTITIQDLRVDLDYLTIPRLAEEAYLRATVTNTSDFILLPGQVSLFRGPDFVGKTPLKLTAPGEEFKVQLGVDDRIRVERRLVKRDVGKVTVIVKNARRTELAYRTKLTNLLDRPAKITVQDQIPLGRHEQIKSKLLDASPQPTEQDRLNVLTWEMDIPKGEKREITFGFSVEHPRDMAITGLGV